MKYNKAFSLVELMIASALGLILMGMIMYTLSTTSRAMNGTIEQVELHNRARSLLQKMNREFGAIQSGTFTRTTVGALIEYQFLTISPSLTVGKRGGTQVTLGHDLVWVKYIYDPTNEELWRDWGSVDISSDTTLDPADVSKLITPLSKAGANAELIARKVTKFNVAAPVPLTPAPNTYSTIQVDIELQSISSGATRSIGFAVSMPEYY